MALNKIISEGIKDSEVKLADMADDSVGVTELSATGTASSSTYLRGDNAWATPPDTTTPADESVTLAKFAHGDGSNNGKFLRANNGADPTWETVDTSIADDSIAEVKLDISNAPSDDSILQYKNSSDKLTWVPRGHQILQMEEWYAKSWSTHTGDTGWHGNVISENDSKITPTATTSKIAVWGNMHLQVDSNNASTTICGVAVRVLRKVSGQSDVEVYRYNQFMNYPEDSGMDMIWVANASFHFVDDPGTTSEIEYRTETSSHHSSATVNIGSADHWKGITMMVIAE